MTVVAGFFIAIVVTRCSLAGWSLDVPDSGQGTGLYTSIVVDSRGQAHIAYLDIAGERNAVKHAMRAPEGWLIEIVDGQRGAIDPFIALGSQGNPMVSYGTVDGLYGLYLALREATGWVTQRVDERTGLSSLTVEPPATL